MQIRQVAVRGGASARARGRIAKTEKPMREKIEIVENWLPRYTGIPLTGFGEHVLLTNFSGVHALVKELSVTMTDAAAMNLTPSVLLQRVSDKLSGGANAKASNTLAHSSCAMNSHSEKSTMDHAYGKSAKKSHVCGALECDCGCHMSALTFAVIGIAGASHAAKLAMFQPQRAPLPPIKLSLRPPILV